MKNKLIIFLFLIILPVSICFLSFNQATALTYSGIAENKTDIRFAKINLVLAEHYITHGDYGKAKQVLLELIHYDPENLTALSYLGLLYEGMGDAPNVINIYKKILEIKPEDNRINYYLGLALDKTGQKQEAIKYLIKAKDLSPLNPYIYYDIGVVYARYNEYKDSLPYFKKAVELKPDFAEAYNNECYGLANIGDYKNAFGNCQRAIELNPLSAASLDSMGFVLYGLNEADKSIEYYQKGHLYRSQVGRGILALCSCTTKNRQKSRSC